MTKSSLFIKNIYLLIALLLGINIGAQDKSIEENRKKFDELELKQRIYSDSMSSIGVRMLKLASNNYEKSTSYLIQMDGANSKSDYIKAIELGKTAESYANKTDSLQLKMRVYNQLIYSYRRAGLITESDENFKNLEKLFKNASPFLRESNLLFTKAKIYDIDKDYCKAADLRERFLNIVEKKYPENEGNNQFNYSTLAQLTYVQVKCGKDEEAQKNIIKSENLLKKINLKDKVILREFIFMSKALLYHKKNDKENARKYFDSAYIISRKVKNKATLKQIIEEKLEANLDSSEEQLKLTKELIEITKTETTATKNLSSIEAHKKLEELENKQQKITALIIISSLITIAFALMIYLYRRRNKAVKEKYLRIIDELQQEQPIKGNNAVKVDVDYNNPFISIETEEELLKNLSLFESKNQFTKKGISTAQMAVLLKTNTKYLNYILKKYRNSDFNSYINTCRINYIVKELHDQPQLLQYKIAALSEQCGYTSHSQFTSIFKAQKGISPSQYIHFLKNEKKIN